MVSICTMYRHDMEPCPSLVKTKPSDFISFSVIKYQITENILERHLYEKFQKQKVSNMNILSGIHQVFIEFKKWSKFQHAFTNYYEI